MARIRTIKPEFPHSESVGRLSRDARLLFIQLWTICDDSGRARASSRMLASLLFPYDDDAPSLISGWLDELEGEGCIRRYTHDGQSYLDIPNWLIHQKIDKPSASKFPAFDESSRILAESSRKIVQDQGRDQGKDQGEKKPAPSEPVPVKSPAADKRNSVSLTDLVDRYGVDRQVAADWLAVRKDKRAKTLTETAMAAIEREAGKAGMTVGEAIRIAAERGWQGFNADWLAGKQVVPLRSERPRLNPADHDMRGRA